MSPPLGGAPARQGYQVVVMAKSPRPGLVKTRLCPPLRPEQAAGLAAAALMDTLDAVEASGASQRVLALEGPPRDWLRPTFSVIPQRSGDLGARLAGAMEDAWARVPLPMLLIGMDTPQLSGSLLDETAAVWEDRNRAPSIDAVVGPAHDGGYWVIGVRRPVAGLFDGVEMSTPFTGEAQRRRLDALGVTWIGARGLRDVDDIADAVAVAALAPRTRFASALAETGVGFPVPLAGRGSR